MVRYNCADSLDRTNAASYFGAVQASSLHRFPCTHAAICTPACSVINNKLHALLHCQGVDDCCTCQTKDFLPTLMHMYVFWLSGACDAAWREMAPVAWPNACHAHHTSVDAQVLVEQCRRLGLDVEASSAHIASLAQASSRAGGAGAPRGGGTARRSPAWNLDISAIHARIKNVRPRAACAPAACAWYIRAYK